MFNHYISFQRITQVLSERKSVQSLVTNSALCNQLQINFALVESTYRGRQRCVCRPKVGDRQTQASPIHWLDRKNLTFRHHWPSIYRLRGPVLHDLGEVHV